MQLSWSFKRKSTQQYSHRLPLAQICGSLRLETSVKALTWPSIWQMCNLFMSHLYIHDPKYLTSFGHAFVMGCCRDLNSLKNGLLRCSAAPQPCRWCVTNEIYVLAWFSWRRVNDMLFPPLRLSACDITCVRFRWLPFWNLLYIKNV